MPTSDADEMLTVSHVADILGIAARCVRRMVADGRLPAHRHSHTLLRVARRDVDALLESTRTAAP